MKKVIFICVTKFKKDTQILGFTRFCVVFAHFKTVEESLHEQVIRNFAHIAFSRANMK